MCTCNEHTNQRLSVNEVDPTHTLTLRNTFVRDMNRRFDKIIQLIRQAVDTEDVFGLRTPQVVTFQTPGPKAFEFATSQQKIEQFMAWLNTQIDNEILEITRLQQIGTATNEAWTNIYISNSYKRGVQRANGELKKAGFTGVQTVAERGGIDFVMNTPFHIDRVGLLFARTFQDLKGITAAMDTHISRILAQGLADGDGPALLARKMVSTINGAGVGELGITDTLGRFIPAKRRAQILARTEVIRAHHQGMMQEYKNWRISGVRIKAEFVTAGDNRVCSQCEALNGEIFTLEEATNLIPVHPQCRCIALPFTG